MDSRDPFTLIDIVSEGVHRYEMSFMLILSIPRIQDSLWDRAV